MKITQNIQIDFTYEVHFTQNVFSPENTILGELCQNESSKNSKTVFVIDSGVQEHHPNIIDDITSYFEKHKSTVLAATPVVVTGGELAKNTTQELEKVLSLINTAKIDRHSYLIAVGGGAVLDMAGFAASISHRGVRHIRIPTTVLSQNDSGVGVKNGINHYGKKNFLGTFNPPEAVINDSHFLTTLDDREWRAGTSEAIKVALIKDHQFFDWLEQNAPAISNRDVALMNELVVRCAEWHCQHISTSGDPFEKGSARPLDFGHWAGHKLEQLTNFEIKHGEAVAIGIALDTIYSKLVGLLDPVSCDRVLNTMSNFGFSLFHPELLNSDKILEGLDEFREHLGGELTITLVNQIGHGLEVHEMDQELIKKAAVTLKERQQLSTH